MYLMLIRTRSSLQGDTEIISGCSRHRNSKPRWKQSVLIFARHCFRFDAPFSRNFNAFTERFFYTYASVRVHSYEARRVVSQMALVRNDEVESVERG